MSTTAPAPAWWEVYAAVTVELGAGFGYTPVGSLWGTATWGQAEWGAGLVPAEWTDITPAVLSVSVDTGRSGLFDPGEVGRATVTLFDRFGAYGLSGRPALGALLRVSATLPGAEPIRLFVGRISQAGADHDLLEPKVTIGADDVLAVAFAGTEPQPMPAQTTSERLGWLMAGNLWPGWAQAVETDPTAHLAGSGTPKGRLDTARAAVADAGGTMWADGSGVIHYRTRNYVVADPTPAYYLTTGPDPYPAPSRLGLLENLDPVVNELAWSNTKQLPDNDPGVISATRQDVTSKQRFGLKHSGRDDLTLAAQSDLDERADREMALYSWPRSRVDPVEVFVQSPDSAAVLGAAVGQLVHVTYTGSDPWARAQLVAGYALDVSPDSLSMTLHLSDPLAVIGEGPSAWGLTRWGEATWQLEGGADA